MNVDNLSYADACSADTDRRHRPPAGTQMEPVPARTASRPTSGAFFFQITGSARDGLLIFASRRSWLCLVGAVLLAAILFSTTPALRAAVDLDRVAAIVEEEIITLSDIRWLIEYRNLHVPADPEQQRKLYEDLLNQLINQRLIMKETAKTPFIQVSRQELEQFAEHYKAQFASEQAYRERLQDMGMEESDLFRLFRRQLTVNKFIELRFEPFVIVLPQEIEDYYQNEFLPELKGSDQEIPPLDLVEETIRQILTVRKTTQQLEHWVDNNLLSADLKVLLFRQPQDAPNIPDQFKGELGFRPVEVNTGSSSSPGSK